MTAANGATGKIELTAEVTGLAEAGAADGRPAARRVGHADTEKRVPMIVSNTGTAPLDDVQARRHRPDRLGRVVRPARRWPTVQPNETAQVTAIIKPAKDAVAGDYALTVRSSAGSESSNVDLRYTLQGSRTLGFVAIAVIVVAFLALAGVFVRFGRR